MTLTLREMAERLKQLKSATIFCHMRPDGDTLGAAMGLKCMLESCGARCSVVCESKIPDKFLFLEGMGEISRTPNGNAEAYIAVDSSEIHRLGFLGDAFERAKKPKFNIDHHISNSRYGDYCYVEDRAATARTTTLENSLESHFIALAAEQSRLEGGRVIDMDAFRRGTTE